MKTITSIDHLIYERLVTEVEFRKAYQNVIQM